MKAWEDFLEVLEKEFGEETIKKWVGSLQVTRYDACNLYLHAQDSFQVIWFEEHIRPKLKTGLVNKSNKKIKVHLSVAQDVKKKNRQDRNQETTPALPPAPFTAAPPFQLTWDHIDSKATFDNFIPFEGNLISYKLLCQLAGYNTGSQQTEASSIALGSLNPIYIYGGSGTGRTHLLMALANCLQKKGIKTIYTRAETFTEHVVSAIRAGEMQTFRKAYRTSEVLLVDDIQIFSRKGATQEEFFHTFNTLHMENKQIILTANCSPQDLKLIEPRLISRFEWGIVLNVDSPQPEQMKKVLLNKAAELSFSLQDKVVDFLLHHFSRNLKTLTKALDALVLRTHLLQAEGKSPQLPLNVESVSYFLQDLIRNEQQALLTPCKIIQTVAEYYGIKSEDILGKAQSRECTLPRQIAMHLCRNQLKMPYMKIGDLFSRDHSTVMTSVKQIQKGIDSNDLEIGSVVACLVKQLRLVQHSS